MRQVRASVQNVAGNTLMVAGLLATVLGLFRADFAAAQQAVLPKSITPDVRLEQLPPTAPPEAPTEFEIPEAAPSRAPPGAERIRFVLAGVDITGATAYPPETLAAAYEPLVGQEVALTQIYEIAAELQRLYRTDGYFLTRVIIPAQQVADRRIRLQVLEGFVDSVVIEGEAGPVERRVLTYLERMVGQRPLKLETLERYLLLSRDLPGMDVSGVLRPSPDQVGAAQLVASVQRKPFDAMALVDNLGTSTTEEWEIAASGSSNSFTSGAERITLTGLLSNPQDTLKGDNDNQKVAQLSGSTRIGPEGGYLNALASYGDSNPGDIISQFDFESTTLLLSLVGGYPIIRSRHLNFSTEVGFDFINSDTDIFGNEKFSRDRNRVLHLSGLLDFQDPWRGATSLSMQLRKGLDILDASNKGDDFLSRPDGSGEFTSVRASASRLQGLTRNWNLLANLAGQYAFDDVLADEEFGVGGTRFGRGYDPEELSRDHGVGFTGELHYNREPKPQFVERLQLFGFYDFGKVWTRSDGPSDSLASAGAGARGWMGERFLVELTGAKPLTRDSQRADGDRDWQVLFRAVARF